MKTIRIHVPKAAPRSLVRVDAYHRRPVKMRDRRERRPHDKRSKRMQMGED